MRYDPKKIEARWQKKWLADKTYEPDFKHAKKPFYNLMMFPYTSAEGLHIGGMRTFTGVDIYGRLKRMQGYDVFEPIGLDAFGIHSENYGLKTGRHPMTYGRVLEKNFYRQLAMMGNGFAWDERLETNDAEYYRWTQWIFVQMFKRGLAYRKKQAVNWCPSCKTVLADEQVIAGECERCGSVVVKKELEQWFFRITQYTERLLQNLEKIDWSERVKIAQKNWIGKSEGAMIKFKVKSDVKNDDIEVFTTRPDTLFGATYLVVAPEHEFIESHKSQITNYVQVVAYVKKARTKAEADRIAAGKEKTGVELKGIKAINPANNEEISIFVADYVLGSYGTGAIMAVPAHDERDFAFAKKYKIANRQVIEPVFIQTTEPGIVRKDLPFEHRDAIIAIVKHWSEEKYIGLKWKTVAWQTLVTGGIEKGQTAEEAAKAEIREEAGFLHPKLIADLGIIHGKWYHVPKQVNRFGHARALYFELQDGAREAISEAEQKNHDMFWFSKEDLEKFLSPESHRWALAILDRSRAYTGDGILTHSGSFTGMDSEEAKWEITKFVRGKRVSQYHLRDWLLSRQRYWGPPIPMIFCEVCKNTGRGERPEMPGWYAVPEKNLPVKLPFVKDFRPTGTDQSPLASVATFYKVRCPKCKKMARRETDVSDTFLDSAWYFLRYPSTRSARSGQVPWDQEITKKWLPVSIYIGGAEHSVLHLMYSRFLTMAFCDWKLLKFEEPFPKFRAHGLITKDGAKMSKSKGNVVNPDDYIRAYGADAVRMYLAFLAPFEQGGDFRDTGIRGITRFLERVWKFAHKVIMIRQPAEKNLKRSFGHRPQDDALQIILHKTIKKVTEDIENLQYNTAISALMILLNEVEASQNAVGAEDIKIFLKLLAPFAPHITEELWQKSGNRELGAGSRKFRSIHREAWPKYNPRFIQENMVDFIFQINGKTRVVIEIKRGSSQQEATRLARNLDAVKQRLPSEPTRVIFIPDKLINFVVQ
ncbi:MAG: class I tRNA ligase family protein [Candidatus Sungbacteria bacterium]|nr:class I tRNA ligase family protein [Candidatus Sungbacteria bacterium]